MKLQTIIPYILAVVFLCSCGSKKKVVEKEKIKIETSTVISQTEIKETKKDSSAIKTETKSFNYGRIYNRAYSGRP